MRTGRMRTVVTIVGSVVVGVILFALAAQPFLAGHTFLNIPVDATIKSLGEVFVVTGVLGFLVDRNLKREFADEISQISAEKTASVFFNDLLGGGRGLPDEYFDGMKGIAATDALALILDWTLTFEWADQDYLAVTCAVESTSVNIGASDWVPLSPWVIDYYDGRPPSRFTEFEYEITVQGAGDHRAPVVTRKRFTEAELAQHSEPVPWGHRMNVSATLGGVPPGGMNRTAFRHLSYHRDAGVFPIVCANPSLQQRITLTGAALDDLRVVVMTGHSTLVQRPEDRGTVHEIGFGVRGTTIRISWSRASQSDG